MPDAPTPDAPTPDAPTLAVPGDRGSTTAEFDGYVRRAVRDIAARRERRAAAVELRDHLDTAYADLRAGGLAHDAAVAAVLDGMGEATELRSDLGLAHRRRLSWRVVAVAVIATALFFTTLFLLILALVRQID